jgi:aspartyl-tRNA(Asn)/glutamyl-tRNA(Gln) amidotransferase subunit B
MAEMPTAKRSRYLSLGLPKADVLILADELSTADFFDATMAAGAPAKAAANWIMGDIMAACKVGLGVAALVACVCSCPPALDRTSPCVV